MSTILLTNPSILFSPHLEPFASDDDSEDAADADSDKDALLTGKAASLTSTTSISSSSSDDSSSSAIIQQGSSKATRPLDDKDDHELLEGAFKGLSNGKSYVSVKDILDWDFVYTLIAEVSYGYSVCK